MDALQIIKERKSIRKFTDKPIDEEILKDLIDCGRLAPSGHNKQGRYFLVLTDRERINQVGQMATWAKFMVNAAQACIAVFCDQKENITLVEDGSAATENILLAATAYGLGSCWVAGYGMTYAEEVEKYLGAPSEYKLISLIALGYSGIENPKSPPRKELDQVFRWNSF